MIETRTLLHSKWLHWLAGALLVGLVFYGGRGPVGRRLLVGYLEQKTGLQVDTGKVKMARGMRYMELDDVVFREKNSLVPVLRISHVEAEIGFMGLIRRPLHLHRLDVEIDYLNLERDSRGRTRLASTAPVSEPPVLTQTAAATPRPRPAPQKHEDAIPFHLKQIRIEVHEVVYRDHSMGSSPMEMKLNLNFQREYKDITSTDDLAKRISEDLLGNLLGDGGGLF